MLRQRNSSTRFCQNRAASRAPAALIITVLLDLTVLAVSERARLAAPADAAGKPSTEAGWRFEGQAKKEPASAAAEAIETMQGIAAPSYKPTIRVWVHGDSIRPALARARPGEVVMRAENETGTDAALVVERMIPGQLPTPVARVVATMLGKRARQELTLAEGEYVYYEESRPLIRGPLVVKAGE